MKKFILSFFLFSKILFAQEANDKIVYLDSVWNESTKENHEYYRLIKDYHLEKEEYSFEDYYKSGKIQMQGISESKDVLIKKGEFNLYYENGTKKETIFYEKGRPKGNYYEWYENGQKCIEGEYIADEKNLNSELKIISYWDEKNIQKVIDGNGELEEKDKNSNEFGKIKNGFKDGVWVGKNKKPIISYTETYENGILKNGISIDSLNIKRQYNEVFMQPRPKKGLQDFYKHIRKKFKIPRKLENISGKIVLNFVINTDGSIENIKVAKSINYDLDQEAIRVLQKYPDWSIGEFRGIKVKTSYSIPITIQAAE